MSLPKLYYNIICPPCRAVYMLTRLLNIRVEFEELDILSNEYKKKLTNVVDGRHSIPILDDNGFILSDSHAISPYLVQVHSDNRILYPSDVKKRAVVDQWLHYDSGVLYPMLYQAITPILFRNQFGLTVSIVSRVEENYGCLDKLLVKNRWLTGENMTLADLSFLTTMTTMDMLYPVDEARFKNLFGYLQRCEELEHYASCNLSGLSKLAHIIQAKIDSYHSKITQKQPTVKTTT